MHFFVLAAGYNELSFEEKTWLFIKEENSMKGECVATCPSGFYADRETGIII